MNLQETAARALRFVAEGREQAETAVAKFDQVDFRTSIEFQYELERAIVTINTGLATLRATLTIVAAQHEAAALPSELAR